METAMREPACVIVIREERGGQCDKAVNKEEMIIDCDLQTHFCINSVISQSSLATSSISYSKPMTLHVAFKICRMYMKEIEKHDKYGQKQKDYLVARPSHINQ